MKTIGTEINGGIQRGGIHTLHPSTCIRVGCVLFLSSSGFVFLPP
ncbi:amidase [Salmonella enterica subsp. enterica serovar Typhimurium str. CDC 2011K-0870]|nr:amidase [Salmonella enterica subsp. enterica serovar Typhimurium str. CDC 2011K-0870]